MIFDSSFPEPCDLVLQDDTYAYRCRRCSRVVSYEDVASAVQAGGYYYPPICIGASGVLEPGGCVDCGVVLCKELDAYYGRDAFEAARCTKCRRGRKST